VRVGVSIASLGTDEVDFVAEAERLGADSVWSAEFWAGDALTPLAYLAARTSTIRLGTAIAQLGARTPAMLAMSAMSMQALSGGRFVLGVGTSGPQVMEGWHGVRFNQPIRRTRETIEILRRVSSGEPLAYDGQIYTLPLPGGEGRPIRSALPAVHIPVYVAALGPANLRLTGELADGWIGNSFFPESAHVFFDPIREGAAAAGRDFAELELTVAVRLEFTDDVEEAGRRHAAGYAFTFGAMGSARANFYNDAFARQGYADDVQAVQELWRSGRHDAARERVPIEIGLGTNLIGTDPMIIGRLRQYRDAGVTSLRVGTGGRDPHRRLDDLAHLLDLVGEVEAETPAPFTLRTASSPEPGSPG
jgi:F420-dependent oxidoreductase-like protein